MTPFGNIPSQSKERGSHARQWATEEVFQAPPSRVLHVAFLMAAGADAGAGVKAPFQALALVQGLE